MTGVDILAAEEVAVEYAFGWTWFWSLVGIGAVVGIIWGVYEVASGMSDWPLIPWLAVLLMGVGALVGLLVGAFTSKPVKYETQYKVTVSDEVKMADFLEKYEIIETEGKIYTVREREADEIE